MARWFRGRRKSRGSEERAGENPPQQEVPRSGEGALQPIYPDLQPEAERSEPSPTLRAQEAEHGKGAGEAAPGEGSRRRRRGGRGSGSRRAGNKRSEAKRNEAAELEGTPSKASSSGSGDMRPQAGAEGWTEGPPGEAHAEHRAAGAEPGNSGEGREELPKEGQARSAGPQQSRQRQDRGRSRRRGRRGGGKQERPAPAAPLAPSYPEERYQQPVSEVAPDLPAASASQQIARPARQQKKPRGVVVLTIGLPGSGKSSWFKRRGVTPLSSDMLRTLLFDDITEQRYQDLVFSTLRSLLRARLIAGMPWNYIDATNLSPKERHGWIKMAKEFGYEVHAVFFNVPLEVCKERNQKRGRVVPDDVMQRMANKLRQPTFEEGFSKIIMVRVRRADQEPQAQAEETPGADEGEGAD